jgi:hypothetical protein
MAITIFMGDAPFKVLGTRGRRLTPRDDPARIVRGPGMACGQARLFKDYAT